jgi:hypothetical protein
VKIERNALSFCQQLSDNDSNPYTSKHGKDVKVTRNAGGRAEENFKPEDKTGTDVDHCNRSLPATRLFAMTARKIVGALPGKVRRSLEGNRCQKAFLCMLIKPVKDLIAAFGIGAVNSLQSVRWKISMVPGVMV